ncbi:MAG: 2-oxoacid:ferredoxin oxidoreductase subunit beta [Betaproteobacteria bacterium]|nr:2-oxoacid:ferredoxin oxidoreductase subunit beta [Betaproteobacteria bacterium]
MNAPTLPKLDPKDFKSDVKPIWCPGCGDFGVLAALTRASAQVGRPPEEIAVVSGIGCSSRLPAYTSAYGFHGVHGRALPFAIGLKSARPDIEVIAVGGDGDGYSIGGNHFLHACRRNVDLVYIVMDNHVYGMTKGQPSPTTEPDWICNIAPAGTGLHPLNPMTLAVAAGANFIARGFTGDPNGLARLIVEAIAWPGFAFIEVLSPCVTFRPEQKDWKHAVHAGPAEPLSDRARAAAVLLSDDGFGTGIFFKGERSRAHPLPAASRTMDDIERRFAL